MKKDMSILVKQDDRRIRSAAYHEMKTAEQAPAAMRTLRQMGQDQPDILDMLGLSGHSTGVRV